MNKIYFRGLIKPKIKLPPTCRNCGTVMGTFNKAGFCSDSCLQKKHRSANYKQIERKEAKRKRRRERKEKQRLEQPKNPAILYPKKQINHNKIEFRNKVTKKDVYFDSKGFYETQEWQTLRYKVICKYGRVCMCCGAKDVQIHVDHINPISRYPELRLNCKNLQILCKMCNQGKSNKDMTDFRPYT